MELLIIIGVGLTILFGTFLSFLNKNMSKITEISIAMAFAIMILLLCFELIHETMEHINLFYAVIFTLVGTLLLKLLDFVIPNHVHSNKSNHLYHIAIISSISLIIHNVIEGTMLYSTLLSDLSLGFKLALGVSFHNIPLGLVIGSTLYKSTNNKKKTILISLLISFSTFIGGLIMILFKNNLSEFALGIFLAISMGMVIYMVFFELLHHLKHQNKKNNLIGILLGIGLFIVSLLFHNH